MLSLSANYVSAVGDVGDPGQGGIGNRQSQGAGTLQLAYAKERWAVAAVYSRLQANTDIPGGTPFVINDWLAIGSGQINAYALSGYWQPLRTGWMPAIRAGWGSSAVAGTRPVPAGSLSATQSWFVGLEWANAFQEGNALGLALGQPVFASDLSDGRTPHDGNYAFELWYKVQATDHISVTPAIFFLSRPEGQLTPSVQSYTNLGALVKTTFQF
ncbi:MAG: carbohydrate porin [Cyanobium sp.]